MKWYWFVMLIIVAAGTGFAVSRFTKKESGTSVENSTETDATKEVGK